MVGEDTMDGIVSNLEIAFLTTHHDKGEIATTAQNCIFLTNKLHKTANFDAQTAQNCKFLHPETA